MSETPWYCMVDTNILLHFRPLEEIDWPGLLDRREVELVICSAVLGELEKHEKESPDRKIRRRAQEALTRIRAHRDRKPKTPFRSGITLTIVVKEPALDWAKHELDSSVEDDRMIACAILAQQTGRSVRIATDDLVMQEKARGAGIQYLVPLEEDRAPPTETEDEKRMKAELSRLQALERAMPVLSLSFASSSQAQPDTHAHFTLTEAPLRSEDDLKCMAEKKRSELAYPLPWQPSDRQSARTAPDLLGLMSVKLGPLAAMGLGSDQIRDYNERVANYVASDYVQYLRKLQAYDQWRARTIDLAFRLVNSGERHADDIEVFIDFPDGFDVCAVDDAHDKPEPPDPPVRPDRRLGSVFQHYPIRLPAAHHPTALRPEPDVSGPDIKRTQSYTVTYRVRRLKQHMECDLDPICITFPSVADSRSFNVEYQLITTSAPGQTCGTLHVVVATD